MAQYFTDFSEYTAGGAPSDWTDRGDGGSVYEVVADATSTGGKHLDVSTTGGFGRRLLSWDAIDGDAGRADFEIVTRARLVTGVARSWTGGRASGSGSSLVGYIGTHRPHNDRFEIVRYEPDFASLAEVSWTPNIPQWVWQRFRVNGTSLKFRRWDDGDAEPSTWQIEITDSSVTAAGSVGLGQPATGPGQTDIALFDVFGVGTNGDPAPTEAPPLLGPNGRLLRGPNGGLLRLAGA